MDIPDDGSGATLAPAGTRSARESAVVARDRGEGTASDVSIVATAAATCTRHTARRPRHVQAISASPGPIAVTNPSRDTAATAGLLLCHSTVELSDAVS